MAKKLKKKTGELSSVDLPLPVKERDRILELRAILISEQPNRLLLGAAYVLKNMTKNNRPVQITHHTAVDLLLKYVRRLLDRGQYLSAALLLWGDELFTAEPRSVKMIWEEMPKVAELLIQGAGSMGKSYSVAVWLLLDWLRDPTMTCIKVLSVTEEHAKRNVFAHIKNLHANSIIPLPGDRKEKSIQVGKDDKQGIHLMTIPAGDEGKGRLRGFHPVPRQVKHLQFGTLSRIRVILDEAEEIPGGVWEDVDNILITKDGVEHVKVICATNPKDQNSKFGGRCEPAGGWTSVSIEDSERWVSKMGWVVLRLDGARCENVMQRKVVFPGLLTWDGYNRYIAMGDTSPDYYTMARGWFPVQGLHINIIPLNFIEKAKGQFIFKGRVVYCASVDLAFEGGDQAKMTIGRWGKVVGWNPPSVKGVTPPRIMFPHERYGIQIEQQFSLSKGSDPDITLTMTKQIYDVCRNLNITHDWLIVDRTGNGTGVYHSLLTKLGPNVMGLHWGEGATDKIILEDEPEKAEDLYKGVVTELWFASRKFIEFDYLKFGPALKMSPLSAQLTDRRFKQAGKLVAVESKKEYCARTTSPSPDDADSFTMLVHLVRMRSEFTAAMLSIAPGEERHEAPQSGVVDELQFIEFKD